MIPTLNPTPTPNDFEHIVIAQPLAVALKRIGFVQPVLFWYEIVRETGKYRLMWQTPFEYPNTLLMDLNARCFSGTKLEKVSAPTWDQAFAVMRKCGWSGTVDYDNSEDDGSPWSVTVTDLDSGEEQVLVDGKLAPFEEAEAETEATFFETAEEARYELLRVLIAQLHPEPVTSYETYQASLATLTQ